MNRESILNEIKDFADRCHDKQMRKYSDERYIVHPARVMETCKEYTDDITMLAAALLHDVLEDTPVTKEELQAFLLQRMNEKEVEETLRLVEELTDVYTKENYPHWNRKKRKKAEVERMETISAKAQTIKYADILDNTPEITIKDPHFAKIYLPECKAMLQKLTKGDEVLYEKAMTTVKNCMVRKSSFQ